MNLGRYPGAEWLHRERCAVPVRHAAGLRATRRWHPITRAVPRRLDQPAVALPLLPERYNLVSSGFDDRRSDGGGIDPAGVAVPVHRDRPSGHCRISGAGPAYSIEGGKAARDGHEQRLADLGG